jgi:hypothetical protein
LDGPDALVEEGFWKVERLGLHVLRQANGDGAGVGRRREHPHRFGQ